MGAKNKKQRSEEQPVPHEKAASIASRSIAVPGSIIAACATPEAAAAVATQIARSAAVFGVSEVVVVDEAGAAGQSSNSVSVATATLARLLQYVETPPHLRAVLYPSSVAYPELKAAESMCPNLGTPHHVRNPTEWAEYREGVVMRSEPDSGSFVDIGSDRNAHVEATLPVGRRVTLHLGSSPNVAFIPAFSETMLKASVVAPTEPTTKRGLYWGYSIRVATSLSRVLKECPYKGGYDLSVATSKLGAERDVAELVLPRYSHALVVFGGAKSLEDMVEEEEAFIQAGKGSPADVFSLYLNCCSNPGVANIATQDAVPISLSYLHASLLKYAAGS